MRDKTKKIEDFTVTVKPWGFLTLMERKRVALTFITKFAPDLALLFEIFKGKEKGLEAVTQKDTEMLLLGIEELFKALSSKDLQSVIESLMEKVSIDNKDMAKSDNVDEFFAAQSMLFYKVVLFVLEVNFGDFLGKMKSLMTDSDSSQEKVEDKK